ncbi:MAG: hypothetical protein KDD61_10175 [Bdellovibrionales bacterium]|nr:hypothetical protein [Bdellovibrionales bacterium]
MGKITLTKFPNASALSPQSAAKGHKVELSDLKAVHAFVQKYAYSIFEFKDDRRQKALFETANALAVDIDEELSIERALERLNQLGVAYSLTLSKSHQKVKGKGKASAPPCDRFRIIVPIEKTISHPGSFTATLLDFRKHFPEIDDNCFDLARYFFPSTGKGRTYLKENGTAWRVVESTDDPNEILKGHKRGRGRPRKIGSKEFLAEAHTGLTGNFNNGLFAAAFMYAANGKSQEEAVSILNSIAAEKLDETDLRTIRSAYESAAKIEEKEIPKSNERLYFEQTASFLKSMWKSRFSVVCDPFGYNMILEKRPNNVVAWVDRKLLVSEATKIFQGTMFYGKPGRIDDAVRNYVNLQSTTRIMPSSILLKSQEGLTFNRTDCDPVRMETPLFDELMLRVGNSEGLMAFIYSLFVPRSDDQQYVWMYGNGGDGKGALARFLQKLLGSAYHADRAAGATGNKHFTASFVGKRLAVFSDSNATKFVTTELFKEMSGGDHIKVERKYENALTLKLDTKYLFLSNSPPQITSKKSDIRRLILCWVNPISVTPDPQYESNLWNERSGILWKCKLAYEALTKNNGPIKVDLSSTDQLAEEQEIPFETIFDQYLEVSKFAQMTPKELYQAVRSACSSNSIQFMEFKQWMIRKYKLKEARCCENGNIRVIRGIKSRFYQADDANFDDVSFSSFQRPNGVISEEDF